MGTDARRSDRRFAAARRARHRRAILRALVDRAGAHRRTKRFGERRNAGAAPPRMGSGGPTHPARPADRVVNPWAPKTVLAMEGTSMLDAPRCVRTLIDPQDEAIGDNA